jgi:DEAD/DEAH box helicase domain-containing protein
MEDSRGSGLDVSALLDALRHAPGYRGQMEHIRELPGRAARYGEPAEPLHPATRQMLSALGVERLFVHQAEALDAARADENLVIATGTASGKSLCYLLPLIETLATDPQATALLLHPTKALSQDQFRVFQSGLQASGLDLLAGVYDGDTSPAVRRKLRDEGRVLFTNPDMLHAGILPGHPRWGPFLESLRWLIVDELHVYTGIFGSNVANLMRRLDRLLGYYHAAPGVLCSSATIRDPKGLAEVIFDRPFRLIDDDGSPRGKRTYAFWNPPLSADEPGRRRRSANVEASELMVELLRRGAPTIAFSKAKMTAEMILRYVQEGLRTQGSGVADRLTAYRGGYLPEERREIERRLFDGELMGVSTTSALELGIDVGGLDACILVGYPGTLSSFHQQAGRAGRRDREALIILVGLDTLVNQYVMDHPEYVFDRLVERAIVDEDNPFIVAGHLRCAAQELPVEEEESGRFGAHTEMALRVLEDHGKLRRRRGRWWHAAAETPQHEVSLRDYADRNVVIEDVDTGAIIGEVNKFDAQPIVHPAAIYMHRGDTYEIVELDLERNLARAKRVTVDFYTQPVGGTDVNHIDHPLRERPFGRGRAYWGEVTAHFRTEYFERIHFYTLNAISRHPVDMPIYRLETMAFWLIPDAALAKELVTTGVEVHAGLRGIGYATRNLLPLFLTCRTLDFSHTVGCENSPWHTVFVYERYPLGLGFSLEAYKLLPTIIPAVREHLHLCPCDDGCPLCVGKPLRGYTTWNVERGEASIPSKSASLAILEGFLEEGELDSGDDVSARGRSEAEVLEAALRRRLQRMREPETDHAIIPWEDLRTGYPAPIQSASEADVGARIEESLRRSREEEGRRGDTGG